MKIRTFKSAPEVASGVASAIVRTVVDQPDSVLSLPTGRTPLVAYEELRRTCQARRVSFSRAAFFQIDEFVGVSQQHPGSFAAYLRDHLFEGLDFHQDRVHMLDGVAPDLAAECERYELAIDAGGGLDLLVLGIGTNGHIGFNEPGDTLVARTHVASLLAATRQDNAQLFGGDSESVPPQALTMGIGTMLRARRVLLVATGRSKAKSVERAVQGPMTTRLPASMLQAHWAVEVYLDREAASLLRTPALVGRT